MYRNYKSLQYEITNVMSVQTLLFPGDGRNYNLLSYIDARISSVMNDARVDCLRRLALCATGGEYWSKPSNIQLQVGLGPARTPGLIAIEYQFVRVAAEVHR